MTDLNTALIQYPSLLWYPHMISHASSSDAVSLKFKITSWPCSIPENLFLVCNIVVKLTVYARRRKSPLQMSFFLEAIDTNTLFLQCPRPLNLNAMGSKSFREEDKPTQREGEKRGCVSSVFVNV